MSSSVSPRLAPWAMFLRPDMASSISSRMSVENQTNRGGSGGVGTFCTGNSELAGVGTLPAFHRRGIAAAVSSALLAEHFAGGGRAWLSAAGEVARALHAKIGFQDAGVQLNYTLGGRTMT